MTDDPRDRLGILLRILIDQTITLSARNAALRELLDERGVCSAAECAAREAAIRERWALQQPLRSDEVFLAALRQALAQRSDGDESPPAASS
jgi:hypothetical protein